MTLAAAHKILSGSWPWCSMGDSAAGGLVELDE
jgi:hypothetical protein